jgi:1,4-alpha-glucan branching enzyme
MSRMEAFDITVTVDSRLMQFVDVRPIIFTLDGRRVPQAKTVSIVGPFNDWDPKANPLVQDAGGRWTATLLLPPGAHPYLFFVDGVPWNDPEDDGRVPSEWGGFYSLRIVNRSEDLSKAGGRAVPAGPPIHGA